MDIIQALKKPGSVLFCGKGTWLEGAHALWLTKPADIIWGQRPEELIEALQRAERLIAEGHIVAGYISYEAAPAFGLPAHEPLAPLPLFWLGVYDKIEKINTIGAPPALPAIPDMSLNISREQYIEAIARIKAYIASGDTYQVNYTCHARFVASLDPAAYFVALMRSHPVPYAAFMNIGEAQILSLSPELLLKKRGEWLTTKPMKGTRKRGRTPEEDEALRAELTAEIKDRAENLMIVDMMRNDLGRVCEIGSVSVPALFETERYRSVWQMTTTVTGRVSADVSLSRILEAIFPGSSVTGAPKKRTMEIIQELEREPRGVYCGAIGLFLPNGDFTINLPIRTLVHQEGKYDLGIGSGIVWDSDPLAEYEETLLKSQFARRLLPDLRLLETMLVSFAPVSVNIEPSAQKASRAQGGSAHIVYEQEHLQRLARSAHYWDFPFDIAQAKKALREFVETEIQRKTEAESMEASSSFILRLELDQEGDFHWATRPLPPPVSFVRVLISEKRTDFADRFLYHKTNQRALYEEELARAQQDGYFEVIFCNKQGHITEGAITNVFVCLAGRWLTPPLYEGLLPGIWRADFMEKMAAKEEPVTIEMLTQADEIVIGNSVRGAIYVDEIVSNGRIIYRRKKAAARHEKA